MGTSIVITNYNYGKFLARAIRSCIEQSEQAEIIVVDDCSTDDSRLVIESFKPYITTVINESNCGLAESRNRGIAKSSMEYILFVDADDCIHEHTVAILQSYLDFNPHCHAVEADYFIVDENVDVLERRSPFDVPIACGIMFRRSCLQTLNGYKKVRREDRDLRKRLEKAGMNIGYVDIPLYRYKYHGCNSTLKEDKKWQKAQQNCIIKT